MKTKPYNPAMFLKTDEDMIAAINLALNDDDPKVLMITLGDIAKIKGIANIAKDTGMGRESLYKSFSGKTKPQWATVHKIMDVFGIKLHATM